MAAFDELITLGVFAACCCVVWVCIHWVLGPLNRTANDRRLPFQFGLADLLCLFVLVQLPVGIVHWLIQFIRAASQGELTMDLVLMLTTALLWLASVRILSRAGIHVVWRRCVVLAVVLPCTIAGSIAVPGFLFAAFGSVMDKQLATAGCSLLAAIAVVGILYGLGRFTRATVVSAKGEP